MNADGTVQYSTFFSEEIEPKRPSFRDPHTMDPRTWFRDLTPYFLYLLFFATLGPFLFGFHLVWEVCFLMGIATDNGVG
jgi:hypothetical protein